MKVAAVILAALLLSGCATRPEALENRLVCTVSGDGAMVVSMWGSIGLASKIAPRDGKLVCE